MSGVKANEESVPEVNNPEIMCKKCHLSFTRKSGFYKHMRKFHPEEDLNINRSKVCGICDEKTRTLSLLHEHIAEKHDVGLEFTEEKFYCEDDFLKWKSEVEKRGQSNFIQERGSRDSAKEGVKLRCYVCHRSGFPAAVGNKERHSRRKTIPSIKIGFTCPASMYVVTETVDEVSCIKVKYQSVHVGHELGVRLRLAKEDKARLASSLNAGVSIASLLRELRENYPPSHPYHQITRKDLHNIGRDFKLSKTRLLQEDEISTVDFVAKKIHCSDLQTALLVYKSVGETLSDYPAVNENDFLLGIMNDVQEKLLELYGHTCIMVDSTGSRDNFYLSTLMVRAENNESLPVATFFSSKTTVEILQPFFDAIQRRLPELKTKFIMSDDVISFYNAWQKVFKDESQHLLCSWFVHRNLFRNVEIKVKNENRKAMKNYIKAILKEEDIAKFEFMIKTFIEEYEVQEKDFITYFKMHYEPRTKKWAYCYRIAQGMNPDMRLARWRDQLKSDEKGTDCKRLDKTLTLVYSTIARRLISNAIVMDMEKLTARILLTQKFHEESLSMRDECSAVEVSEKKCTISDTESGFTSSYVVEKLMPGCGCDIRCEACSVCIHSMSCTCVDYCVHFAVCKHMHRFCRSFAPPADAVSNAVSVPESEDSLSFCDSGPVHAMETEDVKSTEPVSDAQCSIYDLKATVKTQLCVLEKRLEEIDHMEVIRNVAGFMSSINSYLDDAVPSCSLSN